MSRFFVMRMALTCKCSHFSHHSSQGHKNHKHHPDENLCYFPILKGDRILVNLLAYKLREDLAWYWVKACRHVHVAVHELLCRSRFLRVVAKQKSPTLCELGHGIGLIGTYRVLTYGICIKWYLMIPGIIPAYFISW